LNNRSTNFTKGRWSDFSKRQETLTPTLFGCPVGWRLKQLLGFQGPLATHAKGLPLLRVQLGCRG